MNRFRNPILFLFLWVTLASVPVSTVFAAEVDTRVYQIAKQRVEQLTGKNFQREVPVLPQSRDEFQGFLETQLDKQFPRNELRRVGEIYSLLGLLPRDYDLSAELPELYRDQAGAYYDPETKTIYQLPGKLSPPQQLFLYIHEGVHALQDQYYDIESRHRQLVESGSLDRQLAFSFVMEGHANLIATAAQMNASVLNDPFFRNTRFQMVFELTSRLTDLSADQFEAITQMFGGTGSPTTRSLKKLQDVPLILVQQMADPYLIGQKLWFERGREQGWSNAKQWLEDPPTSTAAVLYGEAGQQSPENLERKQYEGPVYEDSLGSYVSSRWLEVFRERPSWGGDLKQDHAFLLDVGGGTGRSLIWELEFTDEAAMKKFGADLSKQLSALESSPSGYRFQRESRDRYLWMGSQGPRILLLVDDDPNPYPELKTSPDWENKIRSIMKLPAFDQE